MMLSTRSVEKLSREQSMMTAPQVGRVVVYLIYVVLPVVVAIFFTSELSNSNPVVEVDSDELDEHSCDRLFVDEHVVVLNLFMLTRGASSTLIMRMMMSTSIGDSDYCCWWVLFPGWTWPIEPPQRRHALLYLVLLCLSLCRYGLSMYLKMVVVLLVHLADVDDNVESISFDRTCCQQCWFSQARLAHSKFLSQCWSYMLRIFVIFRVVAGHLFSKT